MRRTVAPATTRPPSSKQPSTQSNKPTPPRLESNSPNVHQTQGGSDVGVGDVWVREHRALPVAPSALDEDNVDSFVALSIQPSSSASKAELGETGGQDVSEEIHRLGELPALRHRSMLRRSRRRS